MQRDYVADGVIAYEKLISKIKSDTCTPMKSAIVALYTCDPEQKMKYSGAIGILRLQQDRKLKTKFLRLYHMNTLGLAFEIEVYYEFVKGSRLHNTTPSLCLIDYVCGCVGFLFRTKEDAESMLNKIRSLVPPVSELEEFKKKNLKEIKKKQESGTLKGKLFNLLGIKSDEDEKKISEVVSCTRENSIQFDPVTGSYDFKNLSPDMQKIISKANISKNDLQKQEIAEVVVNELLFEQARGFVNQSHEPKLEKMLKEAEIEDKEQQNAYIEHMRMSKRSSNIPPPQKVASNQPSKRSLLLEEIEKKSFKLKHVQVNQGKIKIDFEEMKPTEDFATNLCRRLQRRKQALHPDEDY